MDHTALMDRLRARIKDRRVCTLVKAFLKSGVMTTSGDRKETLTGTPQGGILSPLLANIALSVRDEHFARQWQQEMGSYKRRVTRRKHGLGNWRLIRFADDFVLMVSGERRHAEALREEAAGVLAPLGLRLAPEKTQVVHIDEGFDFLGFHIRRQRKRGTQKHYVYTKPSEGDPVDQGQGERQNTQIRPAQGRGRAAGQPQPHPARVGELLPARGVEGGIQHGR
ncbi:reverse transcriptase/maturase family protein [Streptomyces nojiriensis]|uniref:reverse transcriptase/maturase family protein n=1 Tax=Streptomyces nojiriensis TaxID=66374 RepID=UPI0035714DE8